MHLYEKPDSFEKFFNLILLFIIIIITLCFFVDDGTYSFKLFILWVANTLIAVSFWSNIEKTHNKKEVGFFVFCKILHLIFITCMPFVMLDKLLLIFK